MIAICTLSIIELVFHLPMLIAKVKLLGLKFMVAKCRYCDYVLVVLHNLRALRLR